ncbi:MAG: YqzL family protein [Bacillota bacterium]|uniref:YqzL family protein n=1 Tax=Virgibacillus salarius TaxID=447199 RepID=A0A941IC39_9BACI|nr:MULTISPECIES: YqzL family protein [Bacillaceae]NAZ09707.1 YqzL family protein [Agaribacter marinus]MBR7796997.1 YqzL family protein [Virgibacillus salarius]MCC2251000.1 YqzL family protein [Virgibacillus sp. AGTR]MDY7042732.1 YqzL family protein [Virgibacillus sp. M23]QRZ17446.1 YqzL family protein [Virgibacillus sp. AGTR]
MIEFTWKVFSQTGNIETYLLMKEMENEQYPDDRAQHDEQTVTPLDTNL